MVPGSLGFGDGGLRGDDDVRALARGGRPIALPMPRLAPVMKRVFPCREGMKGLVDVDVEVDVDVDVDESVTGQV